MAEGELFYKINYQGVCENAVKNVTDWDSSSID